MAHVFISYAHTDRAYARKLADQLLANGFDMWIDDRIDLGTNWEHEIFKSIDSCDAFIVIMSPESYESLWVQRERQHAERRGKQPFPLLLEGEVFPFYGVIQYYDVLSGKLPEPTFIERLASFAPRSGTTGQDIASAPQQRASKQEKPSRRRPFLLWSAVGVIILTVIFAVASVLNQGGGSNLPTVTSTQTVENTPQQVVIAATNTVTFTRTTADTPTPSPTATNPAFTVDDYIFDVSNRSLWTPFNMSDAGIASTWNVRNDPYLVYTEPLNICLLNYDYFSVTLGVSLQTQGRQIEVFYELDGETDFSDAHLFQIPLAETSTVQTYFYPVSEVKDAHPGSRLIGIRLDPVGEASAQSARVEIKDFRLDSGKRWHEFLPDADPHLDTDAHAHPGFHGE